MSASFSFSSVWQNVLSHFAANWPPDTFSGQTIFLVFDLIYRRHPWASFEQLIYFSLTKNGQIRTTYACDHFQWFRSSTMFYARAFLSFFAVKKYKEKNKICSQMTKCRNYIFGHSVVGNFYFFLSSAISLSLALISQTDINDSNNTMHTNTLHTQCNKSHAKSTEKKSPSKLSNEEGQTKTVQLEREQTIFSQLKWTWIITHTVRAVTVSTDDAWPFSDWRAQNKMKIKIKK